MNNVSVMFAYDLGGRVTDIDKATSALESAYGDVNVDPLGARSFNLSYVNWHDPILSFSERPIVVALGPDTYLVRRIVFVYPWLGVLHLQLSFDVPDGFGPADLLEFYDDLVAWKNRDYLPYLDRSGAMSPSLRRQSGYGERPNPAYIGHIAEVVDSVRLLLDGFLAPRPARYAFHDFRTIFVTGPPDASNDRAYQDLLGLVPAELRDDEGGYEIPADMTMSGARILSSGWVSVLKIPDTDRHHDFGRQIGLLIRLVHAQWFVCQAWTYLLGTEIAEGGRESNDSRLYELARFRGIFDADLTEVGNADLMLKDPRLIAVSQSLAGAFNINRHRQTAIARFESVAQAEAKRLELQRTVEAERLQLLFSISAAVAIASLLPLLAGAKWPIAIATIAVAVFLCIGFIVNIAVLIRKMARSRQAQSDHRKSLAGLALDLVGG